MTEPTPVTESVTEDDLCPICHLLLYFPVKTTCSHILCRSCMAQWADASQTIPLHPSSLDMNLSDFDPTYDPSYELEARCPMCRTPTTASVYNSLAQELEIKYPQTYAERRAEENLVVSNREIDDVEGVVILTGNRHQLVGSPSASGNEHDWTFFVRLSRPELVSYIRVNLHPTFRPPFLILRSPPFEVRRIGWGYFNIQVTVVLKEGWEWVGGTEVRGELSDRKGALALGWMLDFDGDGKQGRTRAGVRRIRSEEDMNENDSGSPIREPSPVQEGSPVRDVSPVRWPHMDGGE